MQPDLKLFADEILGVNARYISLYGSGVAAGSHITPEGSTSGVDVTNKLHTATVEFVNAYRDQAVSGEQLQAYADQIEGLLTVEVTLMMISQEKVDHLLDAMSTLLETRK